MYTTILPPLSFLEAVRTESADLGRVFPGRTMLFGQGRQALAAGIDQMGFGSGDVVLMPASMCAEVLKVFAARGISLCYYRLDRNLNPDIDDIRRKITEATKLLYVNHYFGFPAPVTKLKSLCDEQGIYMLEDCALTLGSRTAGKLLGEFGDLAIFSPWKFLPLFDGGVLGVNNPSIPLLSLSQSRFLPSTEHTIKEIIKSLAFYNLFPLRGIKNLSGRGNLPPVWIDKVEVNKEEPQPMSRASRFLLKRVDIRRVQERRRKNFSFYLNAGLKGLYSVLPDDVVPFAFPVLCEDKGMRDRLYTVLVSQGIYVEPSINYPYCSLDCVVNKNERFEDVEYLGDRVLSLPVHQALRKRHLKKILDCFKYAD